MSKQPTHRLVLKEKDGKRRTIAGAGWVNEEGWISLQLNPGVVLDSRLLEDHYLSLYPYDRDKEEY